MLIIPVVQRQPHQCQPQFPAREAEIVEGEMINKKNIIFLVVLFVAITAGTVWANVYLNQTPINSAATINLKLFSPADIKTFDGTDNNKPIYIGLNGFVYDVSAGREFYKIDGPYHYLAGKDSSVELNLIGGAIIKRKYPIIGKLIK